MRYSVIFLVGIELQVTKAQNFTSPDPIFMQTIKCCGNLEPYNRSKLELKSNSSEILPVNCKFIYDSNPT